MAGIYARVEMGVGPHKAPANEIVEGAQDLTIIVDDATHGLLNDNNVNVIRAYLGRELRAAGARTVSSDAAWRYIGTRRLFIMLERSIRANAQWIVFEPNNPALWARVDTLIRSFLEDLWQRGFLDGATRADAYTVRCDATTNQPAETDAGRVICEIGVLPPWPAEFVIVRIGITEGGVEMISAKEAQVA
jgi:phage tail sheath protein FI